MHAQNRGRQAYDEKSKKSPIFGVFYVKKSLFGRFGALFKTIASGGYWKPLTTLLWNFYKPFLHFLKVFVIFFLKTALGIWRDLKVQGAFLSWEILTKHAQN